MRGTLRLLALAAAARAQLYAPCPNLCNGHGHCKNADRVCECFDGYFGGDCSLMKCPYARAWADEATATDRAHNLAECSGRGICDRATGTCSCEAGRFEGAACERKTCTAACNGHGRCQSMSYLASLADPGAGTVYPYTTVWDAKMMEGCDCDDGYFGPDCSLRSCPSGDDPLTGTASSGDTIQINEQQLVTCQADGGTFVLSFRNAHSANIAWDADVTDFQAAFEAIPTVTNEFATATTIRFDADEACGKNGNGIAITFLQDFGDLPAIVPDGRALTLSTSGSPSIAVSEVKKGTKEDEPCSNRGLCALDTGVCTCSTGYDTSDGYADPGQRGDCGYATSAITACPGETSCSAHGVCAGSPTYRCECANGWTGADCSEMTCPYGLSWFSQPTEANTAHAVSVECSDMGTCDRTTGECTCADGFTGGACQLFDCPGDPDCTDHGTCLDMSQLAEAAELNGDATAYTYGATPNDPHTWDATKVRGCRCDDGYEGYDCSLLSCPYGDDPLTKYTPARVNQQNERQAITCTLGTTDDSTGTVYFTFRQQPTASLDASTATLADLKLALEALSTITSVKVYTESTADDGDGASSLVCSGSAFYVEFLAPTADVPLFTATTSGSVSSVSISEETKGTKEWIECSGRGLCLHETGVCECFTGFGASDNQGSSGVLANCGYHEPIVII